MQSTFLASATAAIFFFPHLAKILWKNLFNFEFFLVLDMAFATSTKILRICLDPVLVIFPFRSLPADW